MTTQKRPFQRKRFAPLIKPVRPRQDQVEAMERIMLTDPECTWSSAIRRGLDLFIAERTGMLKSQQPQILHDILSVLDRIEQSTNTVAPADTSRTPARQAGHATQSAAKPRARSH